MDLFFAIIQLTELICGMIKFLLMTKEQFQEKTKVSQNDIDGFFDEQVKDLDKESPDYKMQLKEEK